MSNVDRSINYELFGMCAIVCLHDIDDDDYCFPLLPSYTRSNVLSATAEGRTFHFACEAHVKNKENGSKLCVFLYPLCYKFIDAVNGINESAKCIQRSHK